MEYNNIIDIVGNSYVVESSPYVITNKNNKSEVYTSTKKYMNKMYKALGLRSFQAVGNVLDLTDTKLSVITPEDSEDVFELRSSPLKEVIFVTKKGYESYCRIMSSINSDTTTHPIIRKYSDSYNEINVLMFNDYDLRISLVTEDVYIYYKSDIGDGVTVYYPSLYYSLTEYETMSPLNLGNLDYHEIVYSYYELISQLKRLKLIKSRRGVMILKESEVDLEKYVPNILDILDEYNSMNSYSRLTTISGISSKTMMILLEEVRDVLDYDLCKLEYMYSMVSSEYSESYSSFISNK